MEKKQKKDRRSHFFRFFFFLLESKMCPKNQKMNPKKQYLEVSNSIRDGDRAFFRFIAKRKN
jgi:hypothetical protein